jgi:ribosomal protein S18 acetylase RimI-like enzyme
MTALEEKIQIRQVTREDLPALEWDGEYRHFRRLFADAYQRAERGEAVLWIAELPEIGIIGQLFVQIGEQSNNNSRNGGSKAYIYGFRVRAQYRDQGIGSRLLETAEADLSTRGFHRVALNVGRDNNNARRLYERFGYRVVAPEPGIWSYIDHRGRRQYVQEPAWRMEKEI